jgi:pyruvate dehydrogenase E2 component (dihydrolipoamide acetyltransferase)
MPVVSICIPQIGEGLQEARLVAVLKNPGDFVRRDEPLYQMETDKAVMDVESPFDGKLVEWLAGIDAVLPIGGEVARLEVAGEGSPSGRNASVPPRTRAYAKERGVADEVLARIPAKTGKLMPEDIDAYLAAPTPAPKKERAFDDAPLTTKQRLLASRLVRGNQLSVPGSLTVQVNWEPILALRAAHKARREHNAPSAFTMFAYAAARAIAAHPQFRRVLIGDSTGRTYRHVALGIAVALPGDELVTAVVEDADTLDWTEFAERARAAINLAREGKDQVSEAVTMTLTNMQGFGLRDAVPVVVPPAVGVLFLGEIYNGLAQGIDEIRLQKSVNVGRTFDHRLLNGVGAANFVNTLKEMVENIGKLIPQ